MPQQPPLQPHPERLIHSQLSNGPPPLDNSTVPAALNNMFPDSQTAPSSSNGAPSSQFSAELSLVESSGSASFDPTVSKMSDTNVNTCRIGSSQSVTSMKSRPHQHHNHHHPRRTGSSHRNFNGGGEWPNRRAGYHHHRNHSSSVADKSFNPSKVKQIYVVKQPTANVTTASGTS